ncbi:hypothetical protein [Anaerocolumna xylanovorans]|uniref:Uncharacterized protein n=1 Tax=Anaerocolumna xylanovorans DSM 12503 TaxID=1121345 RepID=A0A1M7YN66_9FIRM|nr:hypothetical protein [Anaerocolumna xylanovorans]SHO54062.1 hypothetical protein SAMN02745217_04501 [Anaerocolumna xylanovorans DSM 12503]
MARGDTPFSGCSILKPFTVPGIWGGRIRAGKKSTSVYCFGNLNSLDRAVRTAGTKGKRVSEFLVSAVVLWHKQQSYIEKERCYALRLPVIREADSVFC